MNILIIKTSAIGDVTHTLPALNALRRHFPKAHITWLVEEASAEILKNHHALDRVLICGRKKWVKDFSQTFSIIKILKEILNFISALRDTEYDIVIDFQNLLKSGIWVFFSKGLRKVGFGPGMDHAEYSYIFLNERVAAVSMENHAVHRELMLLSAIGIPCSKIEFAFPIDNVDREKIKNLLQACMISETDRIVAINPMARWDSKLWQSRKFAQVADQICEKGFRVCFTGAKDDSDEIEKILSFMTYSAVNLAGKTSLKTLAALYEKAELLLTTDTGPMHIAAAINTPVVALFGPTAPSRTGPFGLGHQVINVTMDCSPCFKRFCPTNGCMKEITVKMVMEKINHIIFPAGN
jgi:heptosyltransferase I